VRYSTKADYQPFSEGYWADEKRRTFPLQNTYAEVGRNKKELKAQTTLIPVPLFLTNARLAKRPDVLGRRREAVDHPFGMIKEVRGPESGHPLDTQ
jgi:hypothetical protein